jgi:hypothetical protein
MSNLRPIGSGAVPTLVEQCKFKLMNSWTVKVEAFNPSFAKFLYQIFFTKGLPYITDFRLFEKRRISAGIIFYNTLVHAFPLNVILNPKSSLSYLKFVNGQLNLRDIASHICIYLNSGGNRSKVIQFLQTFKSIDCIPEELRNDVNKGLKEVFKSQPSEEDLKNAKERLANAFKWHVYTPNNANIAKTDPHKIVAVAEHGDKNAKDAVRRIRNLGAKMIVDSIMIHFHHQMRTYVSSNDVSADDVFYNTILKAIALLTPLFKTSVAIYMKNINQLTAEMEKRFFIELKYMDDRLSENTPGKIVPIVAFATTVLAQYLKLFFHSVEILYRSDIDHTHGKQRIAPTFIHPLIIITDTCSGKRVVVDYLYKLYLTGAKNLPNDEVIIVHEHEIPKFKARLRNAIPFVLHENFEKFWELKEYEKISINFFYEVIFTLTPSESYKKYLSSCTCTEKINELFDKKGLTTLLKTNEGEREAEEIFSQVRYYLSVNGHLSENDIDDMLVKILPFSLNKRDQFFDFLKQDSRAASLAKGETVGYFTELSKMINPDHTLKSVIYGCSGSDMLTPCLLGLSEAFLIDIIPVNLKMMESLLKPGAFERKHEELLKEPSIFYLDDAITTDIEIYKKPELIRYTTLKAVMGGLDTSLLITNYEFKILFELVTLGADITQIRCEKAPEFNGVRLLFKRKHYGQEHYEDCVYTFICCDLTKPDAYPVGFKNMLQRGVDVYVQKGCLKVVPYAESYISTIEKGVRRYMLTNDKMENGRDLDMGKYSKNTVPVPPTTRLKNYINLLKTFFCDWETINDGKPVNVYQHYQSEFWLFMNIRKKKDSPKPIETKS